MQLNTKLILFIQNILKQINKKIFFFKIYFATGSFFLFFGFLIGNLFGSFLNIFQKSIIWQGFIIILIILLVELVNYLMYHNNITTINLSNTIIFRFTSKFFKIFYLINWKPTQNFFFKNKKKNCFNLYKKLKKFLYMCKIIIFTIVNTFLNKNIFILININKFSKRKFFNRVCFTQNFKFWANKTALKTIFLKSLNLFKMGILLGFFIDAFKVGS